MRDKENRGIMPKLVCQRSTKSIFAHGHGDAWHDRNDKTLCQRALQMHPCFNGRTAIREWL